MKLFRQVVLPLAIVLALVAGVTYVSHFTGQPPRRATRTAAPDEPLRFVTTRAGWDPDDPGYVAEFELGSAGHYDFWFRNPHPEPVSIALKDQNYAGAELDLGLLPPDQWTGKVNPAEPPSRWSKLGEEEVPGTAVGAVRLHWRGEQPGPVRLAAELALRRAGGGETIRRLEVPVRFVPAVRVVPAQAAVPDLIVGGAGRTVEFDCWSASRDAFALVLDEEQPCFRCTWRPLGDDERRQLEEAQQTRVRSGYRIQVEVREQAGPSRLDLGPFQQRLRLRVEGVPGTLALELAGLVRGPARIVTPGARDRIDLGSFPRSRGTRQAVVLAIEPPARDLKLATSPADLEVTLRPRPEAGQWELAVQAPPGLGGGPLPADSAVLLEVIGAETRRWRIPVVGQATQ